MKYEVAFRNARERGVWPVFARYEFFKARCKLDWRVRQNESLHELNADLIEEMRRELEGVEAHSKHWLGILHDSATRAIGQPDCKLRWNLDIVTEKDLRVLLESSLLLRDDLADLMGYCQMNSCALNRLWMRTQYNLGQVPRESSKKYEPIRFKLLEHLNPDMFQLAEFLERVVHVTSGKLAAWSAATPGQDRRHESIAAATENLDSYRWSMYREFMEHSDQYIVHEMAHGQYYHQLPLAFVMERGNQTLAGDMICKMVEVGARSNTSSAMCERLHQHAKLAIQIDDLTTFSLLICYEHRHPFRVVDNESLLMVAARTGREHHVRALLNDHFFYRRGIDAVDDVKGWTALFFACSEGRSTVVEILVRHKASCSIRDRNGWTAREIAAYRGNFEIVNMLPTVPSVENFLARSLESKFSVVRQVKDDMWNDPEGSGRTPVILRLGSADMFNPESFINMFDSLHDLITGLTVVIKLDGNESKDKILLPLLSEWKRHPAILWTRDSGVTKVVFEMDYGCAAGDSDLECSKGSTFGIQFSAAMLDELPRDRTSAGQDSLIRRYRLPIIKPCCTQQQTAKLTFEFLVLKHAPSVPTLLEAQEVFWNIEKNPCIVGHMDFRRDVMVRPRLRPMNGENLEYQSVNLSAASCVEVDVQVTGDGLPIIYHDYSIPDGDLKSRISKVPRDKFMRLVGNGEPTPTLQALLTKYNSWMALDLRLLYPMLHEMRKRKFGPTSTEVNYFVDCILDTLYNHAGKRNITLSSSSPEVCMALAYKQRAYPVLFITDAGAVSVSEPVASSLQHALHFAKMCGLQGIVTSDLPLRLCPRLVGYVKYFGLACGARVETTCDAGIVRELSRAGVDFFVSTWPKFILASLRGLG